MAVARTHRPVWHKEQCLPCRTCTRRCPVRVFPEQSEEPDSLRGRLARKLSNKLLQVPPCQAACPIGQEVPDYIQAEANGDFAKAQEIILRTNPFPSVCGRLCHHPCMRACVRGKLDEPVEIRALKRFAADQVPGGPGISIPADRPGRVAVVGSGPAGLSAAYFLRLSGRNPTVFEAQAAPGGLLRWAVPAFDLPLEALQADIDRILATGVELKTSEAVPCGDGLRGLLNQGFEAIVVATGAGQGRPLGIPGEDLAGCFDALTFARSFRTESEPVLRGPAVVFGGGYLGAAVARLAVRAGADEVTLLPGITRRVPSAETEGMGLAEEEGVRVILGTRPVQILGTQEISAVRCESAEGLMELPAAAFVAASGRVPADDFKALLDPQAGIFGAGEAVVGPRTVIRAIATGMQAATEVNHFLQGGPA